MRGASRGTRPGGEHGSGGCGGAGSLLRPALGTLVACALLLPPPVPADPGGMPGEVGPLAKAWCPPPADAVLRHRQAAGLRAALTPVVLDRPPGGPGPLPAPGATFDALGYHDVRDRVEAVDDDPGAVSTDNLLAHFAWLREHGYHPVSIDDILAARRGERPLPERAVLLTFDDGYESFYSRVFPLLRLFGYPAVMALVGSWLAAGPDALVPYGDQLLPRSRFLSREQIREMQASGLVEFASHSWDLHHGELANPQGNREPAATTRVYDPARGAYETESGWRARVERDLRRNSDFLEALTGRRPRVMVWPYGAWSPALREIARGIGMPIAFTLDDGLNRVGDTGAVRRYLIDGNPGVGELVQGLRRHCTPPGPVRAAQLDLDYIYDPDPAQTDRNLGVVLDRIKRSRIGTVFLQAFADPDGDGSADALYFPNRHLPVRADLFNRVAWQLRTRAGVEVFAWMPVLAVRPPGEGGRERAVWSARFDPPAPEPNAPLRLSPFDAGNRRLLREIYADLGAHAAFAGLLFHDDAVLSDYEDASPAALASLARETGLPADIARIRANPEWLGRWTRARTRALIALTHELAAAAGRYRPRLRIARNLFARPVLERRARTWFAQDLPSFLEAYDHTALMAMPWLEGASPPLPWLDALVRRTLAAPGAPDRVVFELQTRDWRSGTAIPVELLSRMVETVRSGGGQSMAWYPDDPYADHPPWRWVRSELGLTDFPYLQ